MRINRALVVLGAMTCPIMLVACGSGSDSPPARKNTAQLDAGRAQWAATLPEPDADYGEYPSNCQDIIKAAMAKTLKDPESARYGDFSTPTKDQAIENMTEHRAVYGYLVCTDINAKNSYGGYTGAKRRWFLIRNGAVVRYGERPMYVGHVAPCMRAP
ncbi:hypothetical protein [Caballeronia sp. GAWG1-1]|uniref:hypothetical protein n=1 Tax=Caballeronia sp. GAWG1-1 TaxID=2921742 RepID=UPI00202893E9|nr:hypothetical protein [Caballeronia sp. GAWG1-1]